MKKEEYLKKESGKKQKNLNVLSKLVDKKIRVFCNLIGGGLINYEVSYLMILLKAVMNQKPVQNLTRPANWEKFLKAADFQNVTSIAYLGMLGRQQEFVKEYEEQFYQKYKKSLLLNDAYKSVEEVLVWQMEKHKIHGLILSGCSIQEVYPSPEMSYIPQIEILVDKEKLPLFCTLMEDMDYERKENRLDEGIIYVRPPGIRVVLYEELPVENKVIRRFFCDPVKEFCKMERYKYVHIFAEEEEYIYRIGRMVELYVRGILKVRSVLDFWLFQQKKCNCEQFQWKIIKELIKKARLDEFLVQIHILASLWFGEAGKFDCRTALELEEYILVNGRENRELDDYILPGERMRLDFYRRDREREWGHRKRVWIFPPKKEMQKSYPILEKLPFLIIFLWVGRIGKIAWKLCESHWKQFRVRMRSKAVRIKFQIQERFRRKEAFFEEDEPAEQDSDLEPDFESEPILEQESDSEPQPILEPESDLESEPILEPDFESEQPSESEQDLESEGRPDSEEENTNDRKG